MNAGRELDAVVAEKVMGWKRVVVPKDYDGLNAGVTLLPSTSIAIGWAPKGAYQLWHFCPLYSTDIAATWRVVEKLKERSDLFPQISWLRVHDNAFQHRCEIWRNDPPSKQYGWLADVYADTLPLAICLAALTAVGVEVPA